MALTSFWDLNNKHLFTTCFLIGAYVGNIHTLETLCSKGVQGLRSGDSAKVHKIHERGSKEVWEPFPLETVKQTKMNEEKK